MERKEAADMALTLMEEHLGQNLGGWSLKFDNAKNRLGCCNFTTKTISLSLPLITLNDEDQIKDTILHEIAHALVGPDAKHGIFWKVQCLKIGAKPERCAEQANVNTPEARYSAPCPNCGHVIKRHRMKRGEVVKIACGDCCRKYNHGRYSKKYEVILENKIG